MLDDLAFPGPQAVLFSIETDRKDIEIDVFCKAPVEIQLLLAILVVYPFTLLPSVGGLFVVAFDLIGLGTVVLARVKSTYPWNTLRTNFENKSLEKDLME